jgi:hypothetical protein
LWFIIKEGGGDLLDINLKNNNVPTGHKSGMVINKQIDLGGFIAISIAFIA